ncbi:MAG: CusA/CzcA family heavy metal efflux RND transporter [Archangium sp.]|nr:CusA/CzcA family heavy metal efflux RND transporter [Archangium sp.]
MIRKIAEFSVDHRGAVVALTFALAAIALGIGLRLRLDALPDLTNNQVLVLTRAPGLTPEETERIVTRPIEVALGGVPGILEHRSLSRYGISSVTVIFEDDVSPWLARQMVSERLLGVDLPQGIDRPELGPLTGGLGEIFHVTLSSSRRTPAELLELATFRVAPLLKAVPGIVEVNSWGGAQRTLDVVADSSRLAGRNMTLDDLKVALEDASGAVAAGALPRGEGQVLLRGLARPVTPGELGTAVVNGNSVRAADVAEVREGTMARLGAATANGRGETLYLMAQMLRDANALEVMGRIHKAMPEVRALLPDDVRLDVVYDRSELVGGTLKTVAKNLVEGALLVIAVLLLFLGSWRAGLLVASVIPLSMCFATAAMTLFGIPGNLMSLGALDFGLLVDGAIVLVEGIFHHLHERRDLTPRELRSQVRELSGKNARPVFFSVLVILLVYVPVLSLTGVDGKLFRPMVLMVVFALTAALLLSVTYVPAMASLVLRVKDIPHEDPLPVRFVEWLYPKLLQPGLSRRPFVALGAVALLGVGALVLHTRGVEFTPQLDEGDLVVQTTRAADISLEASVAQALAMEKVLLEHFPGEVKQVISRIGSPAVATDIMGLEQADVFVLLSPREQWRNGWTREQLVAQMQQTLEKFAPGGEPAFTQPIQMRFNELLGGAVTDVAVSIYGEDLTELRTHADALAALVTKVPGAQDVRVLAPPGVPLTTVRPRPVDSAQVGFSAREVLEAVQAARVGLDVGVTYDGQVKVPLRLRLDGARDAWGLPHLPMPVPTGGVVPLSRVATIDTVEAPGLVNRRNGERRLVVGFNVRGADLGSVVVEAQQRTREKLALPRGYRLEWGGQYETLTEASRRLSLVVPGVLILILVVLAMTFSSLRPALIILALVPFASVGGVVSLWLRDMPISLPSTIGFIALSGLAVMCGVVWVTQVLELEAEGAAPDVAAREASLLRVRPILVMSLVAALGFVPMVLATGVGAEVQRPLATVVVGGLLSATFTTLVVLPALYPWTRRRKRAP